MGDPNEYTYFCKIGDLNAVRDLYAKYKFASHEPFITAHKHKQHHIVRFLLRHTEIPDEDYYHFICAYGDMEFVAPCPLRDMAPHIRQDAAETAAEFGHLDVLCHIHNVNWTRIHALACRCGHWHIIDYIQHTYPAHVGYQYSLNESWASGHIGVLAMLMKRAPPASHNTVRHALQRLLCAGHFDAFEYLLKVRDDVVFDRKSSLHAVFSLSGTYLIEYIMSRKWMTSLFGATTLFDLACYYQPMHVIKALHTWSVDVTLQTFAIVCKNPHFDVFEYIARIVDPDGTAPVNMSMVCDCISHGAFQTFKIIAPRAHLNGEHMQMCMDHAYIFGNIQVIAYMCINYNCKLLDEPLYMPTVFDIDALRHLLARGLTLKAPDIVNILNSGAPLSLFDEYAANLSPYALYEVRRFAEIQQTYKKSIPLIADLQRIVIAYVALE
jgi:hypothetical protein